MVNIVISQGDTICVTVADSDGCFEIEYSNTELTIKSDLPGSHIGTEGLIYREVFGGDDAEIAKVLASG